MALALMSVSLVACFVRQNQFTCEFHFLHRSHSLSVCVHASWDLHMDFGQTSSCWSDFSLLLFDSWRSFLTTWSRSTRLETRVKECNLCASFRVLNLHAQWKWMLGYVHLQPTVILRVVCIRAQMLGPERWWTMLEQGKARGNSGGGSKRYWRANRSLNLGIGAKDSSNHLVAGSLFPQDSRSWTALSGKAND